jgi:hypothetical protein
MTVTETTEERLRLLEVRVELLQRLVGEMVRLLQQLTKPRREQTA